MQVYYKIFSISLHVSHQLNDIHGQINIGAAGINKIVRNRAPVYPGSEYISGDILLYLHIFMIFE